MVAEVALKVASKIVTERSRLGHKIYETGALEDRKTIDKRKKSVTGEK